VARAKTIQKEEETTYEAPILTPEDAEDELVALAVNLARQRLIDGTASNQLVSDIIKRGTIKEQLQKEKLMRENELLKVKAEAITSMKTMEELYNNAINAMKTYSGETDDQDFDDYSDYDDEY
jgi:hypothetical protein